ncbi:hypothetical protein [Candidatus Lokiarchaeum ossiferum]|uniref:hypothetical protein n=1 Tax=Candidatus Lokiarchaeum ossiferum TaxID=2951803 RepID=UPI00352F701D
MKEKDFLLNNNEFGDNDKSNIIFNPQKFENLKQQIKYTYKIHKLDDKIEHLSLIKYNKEQKLIEKETLFDLNKFALVLAIKTIYSHYTFLDKKNKKEISKEFETFNQSNFKLRLDLKNAWDSYKLKTRIEFWNKLSLFFQKVAISKEKTKIKKQKSKNSLIISKNCKKNKVNGFNLILLFVFVFLSQLLPLWLLGFLVVIETISISYKVSDKTCKSIEIKVIYTASFSLILLSILGFIELMITRYYFYLTIIEIFQVINVIQLLALNLMTNWYQTIKKSFFFIKSLRKPISKKNQKFYINVSFYAVALVILIRLTILYLNPFIIPYDPNSAEISLILQMYGNLGIFNYFPIDLIILFIILILIFLLGILTNFTKISMSLAKIFFIIVLFSFSGSIVSGWSGLDAYTLCQHIEPVINSTDLDFWGLRSLFFYYTTFSYNSLNFLLISINGSRFFVTFLLPLVNSTLYIVILSITHSLNKNKNFIEIGPKKTLIFFSIILTFILSPIQLKFLHIGNSETLGELALIILIFASTSKDSDVKNNQKVLIFFSVCLSLLHYSHAYLVVPLAIFSLIYHESNWKKNLHQDNTNSFIKFYFFLISVAWMSYLSLEMGDYIESFLSLFLRKISFKYTLQEFQFVIFSQLRWVNSIYILPFLIIPFLILVIFYTTKFFYVFETWEYFISLFLINIRAFFSKISDFSIVRKLKDFLYPTLWIAGFGLLILYQFLSYNEINIEIFRISVVYLGQILILSTIILSIFDIVKLKENSLSLYLMFYLLYCALVISFLFTKPLGEVSFINYFFRLANWLAMVQFILILQENGSTTIIYDFWKKKPLWVIFIFSLGIILINLTASVWEYGY